MENNQVRSFSDDQIKHIEFVQNIITRMNANSFQIKGLVITIVSAFCAVYASNTKESFLLITLPFIILFWFLDSYYLQQERKFREIYNDITGNSENPLTKKPFQINPELYKGGKFNFWDVFFSKTIYPLYIILFLGIVIATILLK